MDDLKLNDTVTWEENHRDGPIARAGKLMSWEQVGGVTCGVVWTHQNGAACVIPRDRLSRARP